MADFSCELKVFVLFLTEKVTTTGFRPRSGCKGSGLTSAIVQQFVARIPHFEVKVPNLAQLIVLDEVIEYNNIVIVHLINDD